MYVVPTIDGYKRAYGSVLHIAVKYQRDRAVVARKAHNLEVVGSTPTPATNTNKIQSLTDNIIKYENIIPKIKTKP